MSQLLMPTFVAKAVEVDEHDHWQGGEPAYDNAVCNSCGRQLLLIWDLNCKDPRFVKNGEAVFKGFARVPLLMCWRCSGSLAYVVRDNTIAMLECTGEFQGNDFPYRDYPVAFPKRPLQLIHRDDIPRAVHKLLDELNDRDDPFVGFTETERQLLHDLLGRSVKNGVDLWWHQVGGEPWLFQGLDDQSCPNPLCRQRGSNQPLKVLAAVKNDPPGGLPMLETMEQVQENNGHFNSWVQLVYYICEECSAIRMVQDLD